MPSSDGQTKRHDRRAGKRLLERKRVLKLKFAVRPGVSAAEVSNKIDVTGFKMRNVTAVTTPPATSGA
jgi:hypothetical protein